MSNVPYHSSILKNYKTYENSFLPKFVNIPISQEYGYNYKILVEKNDIVKEGQVIATYKDKDGNCVNIHSSIPGKVLDFIPTVCPNGKYEYSIRIQLQGSFEYLGKKKIEKNIDLISQSTIVKKLIEKGVVNTFLINKPINLGLEINQLGSKIKTLIVRLCDEDEYRLTDSLVSKFFIEEILTATKIILKALNLQSVLFVINTNFEHKQTLKNCQSQIENFKIFTVDTSSFPYGFKRDIEKSFNKSSKKSDTFKISKNDLYVDSSTLYEVYKAIVLDLPSIERFVHFTGNSIYSSCLLNVKLGTSVIDIVKQIGGFDNTPAMLICNGNQTGTSVSTLDTPITKYTKSIAIFSSKNISDSHIYSCVNCGNCRFVCPSKICPDILYKYATKKEDIADVYKNSVHLCNECCLCNSVCQARLPLGQIISTLKNKDTE